MIACTFQGFHEIKRGEDEVGYQREEVFSYSKWHSPKETVELFSFIYLFFFFLKKGNERQHPKCAIVVLLIQLDYDVYYIYVIIFVGYRALHEFQSVICCQSNWASKELKKTNMPPAGLVLQHSHSANMVSCTEGGRRDAILQRLGAPTLDGRSTVSAAL